MRKVNTKKIIFILIQPLLMPMILIGILLLLVCYITDIFYIGIANEEKSNMKQELKYYTQAEYTKEDCDSFFGSVESFISNLFSREIVDDADWPVLGSKRITSEFGYRNAPTEGASTFHSGIDIAAKEGTKLVAVVDGKVTKTGWNGAGGFTIIITSGEYVFSYSHSDPDFIVKEGDEVEKGQVIGKVGPKNVYGVQGNPYVDENGEPTNGATTGCHCHFSIKKSGEYINPLDVLDKGGLF